MSDTTAAESVVLSSSTTKKLRNCDYTTAKSKWAALVLQKYFAGEVVTVGSLIRKLPYLLIDFARHNQKPWYMYITYDKVHARFVTKLTCPESHDKIVFLHCLKDGVKYENTLEVLNKAFLSDKWVPMPVNFSKVLLTCNDGHEYIYEKAKQTPADSVGEFSWVCYPAKQNLFSKITGSLSNLFKSAPEQTIVESAEVLERKS